MGPMWLEGVTLAIPLQDTGNCDTMYFFSIFSLLATHTHTYLAHTHRASLTKNNLIYQHGTGLVYPVLEEGSSTHGH